VPLRERLLAPIGGCQPLHHSLVGTHPLPADKVSRRAVPITWVAGEVQRSIGADFISIESARNFANSTELCLKFFGISSAGEVVRCCWRIVANLVDFPQIAFISFPRASTTFGAKIEHLRVPPCGGLYEHFWVIRLCGHSVGPQTPQIVEPIAVSTR
jgi:hypothetical protein